MKHQKVEKQMKEYARKQKEIKEIQRKRKLDKRRRQATTRHR